MATKLFLTSSGLLMAEEDELLPSVLPSSTPAFISSQYGSGTELGCPSGSIHGYAINHDEEQDFSSCSLPGHLPDSQRDKKAVRKLTVACCLCFAFMCAELVGGTIARSLAIMTDAAHLFTDFIGFLISLCALLLARRKSSKKLTFGWMRAEILGVMFSIQLIWLVTVVLVYFAVERVRTRNFKVEATPMLITAAFGVGVNLLIGFVLYQHVPHSHSHGGLDHNHAHNHGHGHGHGEHHQNINVRAAFVHCVGDMLQSLGVFTAALIIYFKPDYKIADPICTFIFSLFVVATTVYIFRDIIRVLMHSVPPSINIDLLRSRLLSIHGILACHNFHIWSLTADKHICSVHIITDAEEISHEQAIRLCYEALSADSVFYNITIQVERKPVSL